MVVDVYVCYRDTCHTRPGKMNKEDYPCRTASFAFTIDNILNLKKNNNINFEAPDAKEETYGVCKSDFPPRYEEVDLYDIRRPHEADSLSYELGE